MRGLFRANIHVIPVFNARDISGEFTMISRPLGQKLNACLYGSTSQTVYVADYSPRGVFYGPSAKTLFKEKKAASSGCRSLLPSAALTAGLLTAFGLVSSPEPVQAAVAAPDCGAATTGHLHVVGATIAGCYIITSGNIDLHTFGNGSSVAYYGINVFDPGGFGVDIYAGFSGYNINVYNKFGAVAGATGTYTGGGIYVSSSGGSIVVDFGNATGVWSDPFYNRIAGIESAIKATTSDSGTITIDLNGSATGAYGGGGSGDGVHAYTSGSGTLTIDVVGVVTGRQDGIHAVSDGSSDIDIGFDEAVGGTYDQGIEAVTQGGNITITQAPYGDIVAGREEAIYANAHGDDVDIDVNNTQSSSYADGVQASTSGTGTIDITVNGNIGAGHGAGDDGVEAITTGTGNVDVVVTGSIQGSGGGVSFIGGHGVNAQSAGGNVTVKTSGPIYADPGIYTSTIGIGAIDIDSYGVINATGHGIETSNKDGITTINVEGAVNANSDMFSVTSDDGIYATATSGSISVVTRVGADIHYYADNGIIAKNTGGTIGAGGGQSAGGLGNFSGNIVVTLEGKAGDDKGGSAGYIREHGIFAGNDGTGGTYGDVFVYGSGNSYAGYAAGNGITAHNSSLYGDVTVGNAAGFGGAFTGTIGAWGDGIQALANHTGGHGNILVGVDGNGTIYGLDDAIEAISSGYGSVTVTANNSSVDGRLGAGIRASITNSLNSEDVTVVASANIYGEDSGVLATTVGKGNVSVTTTGTVAGDDDGIVATAEAGTITIDVYNSIDADQVNDATGDGINAGVTSGVIDISTSAAATISGTAENGAMSLSLLKFVGQASLVDDAMLPS